MWGGGTGRGVATAHRARTCFSAQILEIRSLGAAFVRHRIGNNRSAGCTPLPVPPPHGGRERCGTALHTSHPALAFASRRLQIRAAQSTSSGLEKLATVLTR